MKKTTTNTTTTNTTTMKTTTTKTTITKTTAMKTTTMKTTTMKTMTMKKTKTTTRQRPKREFNIGTSGQFFTLVFSACELLHILKNYPEFL